MGVATKNSIALDMTPYMLADIYRRFERTYYQQILIRDQSMTLCEIETVAKAGKTENLSHPGQFLKSHRLFTAQ
jgi:hypothetical protein